MRQYKEDIFVLKNERYRNYQHVKKNRFSGVRVHKCARALFDNHS